MKGIAFSIFVLIFTILISAPNLFAFDRGLRVTLTTSEGNKIDLYRDSYALIVGNSNYINGWDSIPGAIRDVNEVANALEKQGFKITLKTDLTKEEFNRAFGEFTLKYGKAEDDRLLFYYAGHGYTQKMATGEELGYLVMVNAPLPEKDIVGFSLSSVDMQSLVTQAKIIRSRHVLFMFDSCFSGSIINMRERVLPKSISDNVKYPVRQFITAGRANEPVPDYSVFKQAFLDLIEGRDEEPIPDNYITGEELGLYLKTRVPEYNPAQHPQYGKIRDPRLDKGDFVFVIAKSSSAIVEKSEGITGKALLSVETNVSGAVVLVNGKKVGITPFSDMEVPPGEQIVQVEKEGYEPYKKLVRFKEDKPISMYVYLNKEHIEKGHLFVMTKPEDAEVKILNIDLPFDQGMELKPDAYHVEVSHSGYKTKEEWVEIAAGEKKILQYSLESKQSEPKTGELWIEPITGMEFVWIPGGCFEMGSKFFGIGDLSGRIKRYSDEEIIHEVCIDEFWMGKYEVTQDQWEKVMKNNPSRFKKKITLFEKRGNYPVETVSWMDTKEFIRNLIRKNKGGYEFRLPTEVEWEYACRAGTKSERFWGDDPNRACEYANAGDENTKQKFSMFGTMVHNCDDGYLYTSPVGNFRPNGFELHDMLGNVWEWCEDIYDSDAYGKHKRDNPLFTDNGSKRVIRGGGWGSMPADSRCANRDSYPLDYRFYELGFRLVRTP